MAPVPRIEIFTQFSNLCNGKECLKVAIKYSSLLWYSSVFRIESYQLLLLNSLPFSFETLVCCADIPVASMQCNFYKKKVVSRTHRVTQNSIG
jgi:hypothetical protein